MCQTHALTTTTFDLPGYRVVRSLGVVRGIVVRSRSVVGNFGVHIQSLFGGNITLYTELCERARGEAFAQMLGFAVLRTLPDFELISSLLGRPAWTSFCAGHVRPAPS